MTDSKETPRVFVSVHPEDEGRAIVMLYGYSGYWSLGARGDDNDARVVADLFNKVLGVTQAQERAAVGASMFGWHRFEGLCELFSPKGSV